MRLGWPAFVCNAAAGPKSATGGSIQADRILQPERWCSTSLHPLLAVCCLDDGSRLCGLLQVHEQCPSGTAASCSPMGMRVFAWEAQHPRRQQSPPLHPVHCAKMRSMRVRGTFQKNQHGPAFATPACSLQLNSGAGYRVQGLAQTLKSTSPTPQIKAQRTPAGKVTVLVPKPIWHPADQ